MRLFSFFAFSVLIFHVQAQQAPFRPPGSHGIPPFPPRIDYAALDTTPDASPPPGNMTLHALAVTGSSAERVNLVFFADGYTADEADKFLADARRLTDDMVAADSPMAHVRALLNVWAVFVPSEQSGIGTHSTPVPGAAFGLYRPGPELRAVYVEHPRRARAACRHYAERGTGCDQAILLGNDALYGGLGGEFTIITASTLNGPLVLRHELGHSLIPVGEEYEGGYAYFGANSAPLSAVDHHHDQHGADRDRDPAPATAGKIKWAKHLSDPHVVVQDAQVPLQVYPWSDLDAADYTTRFTPNATHARALLRLSVSSIPDPSHLDVLLAGAPLDIAHAFPPAWKGSHDRRWLEVALDLTHLARGPAQHTTAGEIEVAVRLTRKGREAEPGQGGKMLTSLEVVTYGPDFEHTDGFVGAFPTYAMDGGVTLRPTNEGCLMRKVNHPSFCVVCADALERSLRRKIAKKQAREP